VIFLARSRSASRSAAAYVVLATVVAGIPLAASEPGDSTTVILVRHSEKEAGKEDPSLSAAGRERALELARVLADVDVSGLYSSQYRRAIQTLEPLAARSGLEVHLVPLERDDLAGQLKAMAEGLLRAHRGSTVVVSGHSNTVPGLIRALGVTDPPALDDDEYDDLFVVSVETDGSARLLHLHYGALSP